MTTMRSLPYPAGRSLGTLADRSLLGAPTSNLLRSTCSSPEEALADVLRAAETCGWGRATLALGRPALLGDRTATSSSLSIACQPAMPFLRARSANTFLV